MPKNGGLEDDPGAVLLLPPAGATDAERDAYQPARGGNGRGAAMASRIWRNNARRTTTSAIREAIADDLGGAKRIARLCVDTGGRDTAAVYGRLRRLRTPRIAPTKGIDGWKRSQPVQGPTPVDALVNGQKLRRGLWMVSVSTWKADLYRRLWLGRGNAKEWPPRWVPPPRVIEVEWAKLRERNEALDCAVLARAVLWLLGAACDATAGTTVSHPMAST